MQALIDTLPGLRVPVSEVIPRLSSMWQSEVAAGGETPTEFHASQMNLILHFGLSTTPEEAREKFDTAVSLARRYPCTMVLLCPVENNRSDELLEGKIFSQCYIGDSRNDICCCDVLMLGYPTSESGFLENQVSIWLDNDLPAYHWFHHVPIEAIERHYLSFIKDFRRVVFDSSVEAEDYWSVNWPSAGMVHDLAFARTLPARQSIGQFVSGYSPQTLCAGLVSIEVEYAAGKKGEAINLARWMKSCLGECARRAGMEGHPVSCQVDETGSRADPSLLIEWKYETGSFFRWQYFENSRTAAISADFGQGEVSHPSQLKLLSAGKALVEALFF